MTIDSSMRRASSADPVPAPSLAVVVPAYNEAGSVANTVSDIRTTMSAHGVSYSLILVDDGSTDDTPAQLAKLANESLATTKIVTHPRNLGLGRAIVSGYAAASAGWVGWLPADGQFCAEDLYKLYASREGCDAVLGRVKARARERADKLGRVVISWTSRAIMRTLHPSMPRFNGIMVIRRDRVNCERLVCRTGFVNMEILDRLRRARKNPSLAEQEVRVLPRQIGHSKVANLSTTLAVLRDLWVLRMSYLFHLGFRDSRYKSKEGMAADER